MASQWFYGRNGDKHGPFSDLQLKQLAANGDVLPGDTVWKFGVDEGVLAIRIKNLFPQSYADAFDVEEKSLLTKAADAAPPLNHAEVETIPFESPKAEKTEAPKERKALKKRSSATALKGADMVGVTDTSARYRMKCFECGHKDSSCRTIQIANKTTKFNFFCPKCKKGREVVIQCRLG